MKYPSPGVYAANRFFLLAAIGQYGLSALDIMVTALSNNSADALL
jgi:hypothetical protein